ncbi:hypothetical protein N0V93_002687 [Gnomoniopsis smithogilvyi]|uniref:Uncharacterized protein n=1 Tax=Gnomoniopsis smithogilvyi TaxID=1191159 RepID=A0A9W9CXW4_9PEZI|nr:hypothetical protein N0V93_002687 [Gnomoniopsis smithogilvyi]
MQLTETVTIINKSGKVITNGKHIVNIFKEAKAAYQDKKAAIKAERAAAAERPSLRKAHTFDVRSRGPETYYEQYDVPERQYFLEQGQGQEQEYTHSQYIEGDDRRRSGEDGRSTTSSRRSHGSHSSGRTRASKSGTASRPPLSESNLRTLTEVSATTPSQVPRAYRSPYAETAPRDLALSKPTLAHATTAPVLGHAASELSLRKPKKKKEIDMNLAYGNVPPDLASRTDLGPVTLAEEEDAKWREEMRKEEDARKLMGRIDALLDEAECVQHTATSIIDHLQQKPEAAAAVALLLAELSTLLKTMSPGFLGIVKGGFPAIFALLASPQFLIGVGVAVGVTVIFFGGWKIVKRMREAKAIAAEKEENAQAFEMQEQAPIPDGQSAFQAGASYGPPGPGSYDDALVFDEELSSIETWRRGITPAGEDEESVDLELITPEAVRSVRGDAMSIRTTRTHRSSKSHRSRRSHRNEDDDVEVPARTSSRAHTSKVGDLESEAGTEHSRRSSRSKTTVRTKTTKAIEDGSREEDNTLDTVLRPKEKKSSMLKTLFKKKKEKDDEREVAVSVMA